MRVDELLILIVVPDEIYNCYNYLCDKHSNYIFSLMDQVILAMKVSVSLTIPKFSKNDNKVRPGWNKFVKYYKDKSILWNKIWKEGGSPSEGALFEIRSLARRKYHLAIKCIDKNKNFLIKEKVSETLKT